MMNANETYQKFAEYYDAYTRAFEKDLAVYKSFCHPNEEILEVGCGTGRVLQSLLGDGFRITGVDISDEMLAVAQQKLVAFSDTGQLVLHHHNFCHKPLATVYDKVFVTWYTFNYILEAPENFLGNIVRSMAPGAVLVMDLFYPKTFAHPDLNDVWTTRQLTCQGATITLRDKRSFFGDMEERIQIYQENGKETRIHTQRKYYSPQTLQSLLERVGLTEILFSAQYDVNAWIPSLEKEEFIDHFLVTAQSSNIFVGIESQM